VSSAGFRFVIRDDDLNYFSTPADVERWYADVFAAKIPVSFAAVPFVKPASDTYPRDLEGEDVERPIHENAELVDYVRGNPYAEILQHGCCHETRGGVYEYLRRSGLIEETRRGREELERAFGRPVRVFVPPHDAIGPHGIEAIEAAGLDLLRGSSDMTWIPRLDYLSGTVRLLAHKVLQRVSGKRFVRPRATPVGRHREAFSYRLGDRSFDHCLAGLRYVAGHGGDFVVTNHVHHMNEKRRQGTWALIEEGRRLGASFVGANAIFSGPEPCAT